VVAVVAAVTLGTLPAVPPKVTEVAAIPTGKKLVPLSVTAVPPVSRSQPGVTEVKVGRVDTDLVKAGVAGAVGIHVAGLGHGALGRARAAAVHIGLAAVLDHIGTGRNRALVGSTDTAGAVSSHAAAFGVDALGTSTTAAVDIGFLAIFDDVHAGRNRALVRPCRCRSGSRWPAAGLQIPHFRQDIPPQSMSVSVPFLTVSLQLDAMQVFDMQTLLWQSPGTSRRT
jgi:hypothetical protein